MRPFVSAAIVALIYAFVSETLAIVAIAISLFCGLELLGEKQEDERKRMDWLVNREIDRG
jgi:hypothetical protein